MSRFSQLLRHPFSSPASCRAERRSQRASSRRLMVECLENRVVFSLAPAMAYAVEAGPQALATGDINGDNIADVISVNSTRGNVSVLLGNGDGTLGAGATFAADAGAHAVAVGDFDQDPAGGLDAVTANSFSLSLLFGNGDGTIQAPVNGYFRDNPQSVAVGDLDNDGDLDIVAITTVSYNEPVFKVPNTDVFLVMFRNDLDPITHFATFVPTAQYLYTYAYGTPSDAPGSVQIAEINGNSSVVFINPRLNSVSVMPGNGAGKLAGPVSFRTGASPQSVTVADLNHDGHADLAVANQGTSDVSILLGTGNSALFQSAGSFAAGVGPDSVASGDINGDGHIDLATTNAKGGDISLLLGYGDGSFGAAQSIHAGTSPGSIVAADLNADGLCDLLTTNASSNEISVLLSNNDWVTPTRPTAALTGPAVGLIDQTLSFTLGASGEGLPSDTVFSFAIDWNGDGATDETVSGADGTVVYHAYATGGTYTVGITATDPNFNTSLPVAANVHILARPTAALTGPAAGLINQSLSFTLGASGEGLPSDTVFSFAIDWNGDGATDETVSGADGTIVNHAYTTGGTYTVVVIATAPNFNTSLPVALNVHVFAVSIGVETDPGDATKLALVVTGSAAGESIVLSPGTGDGVAVSIDGAPLGEFAAPGGVVFAHVIINAGGGNDVVELSGGLNVPSLVSGEAGDDTLSAASSTAVAILIGGAGNDGLVGGSDRDLLIGGVGTDTLSADGDEDILIGGATDHDANAVALLAIMAEWDQAGVSYGTRVSHLLGGGKGKNASGGLNGSYLLNSTTVHDDAAIDTLTGGTGTDWFLVRTKGFTDKDVTTDKVRGETVTQI